MLHIQILEELKECKLPAIRLPLYTHQETDFYLPLFLLYSIMGNNLFSVNTSAVHGELQS